MRDPAVPLSVTYAIAVGPVLQREVLVGMGLRFAQDVLIYIFRVFVLSYGEKTLGYSKATMLGGGASGAVVGLLSIGYSGKGRDL